MLNQLTVGAIHLGTQIIVKSLLGLKCYPRTTLSNAADTTM